MRPRLAKLTDSAALALAFVLALAVVLGTTTWVVRLWTPAPYHDFWAFVEHAGLWGEGLYPTERLWEQHNEHRILFPRLVFFADYWLFAGKQVLEPIVICANQLLLALLLWRLAGGILQGAAHGVFLALALAATFATVQFENLLLPFQVQFVGVLLAAAAGFWALELRRDRSLVLAILAMGIASFSMANGLLVWPIALAIAFRLRFPRRQIVVVAICGAFATWCYLHGYRSPPHHASLTSSLSQPVAVLGYFLAYLGNPWQALGLHPAIGLGALALLGLLVSTRTALRRRTRLAAGEAALLGIAWFAVGSAALTALGRANFPLGSALTGRYASPAILLWLVVAARLAAALAPRVRGTALLLALPLLPIAWWQSRFLTYPCTLHEQVDRGALGLLLGSTDDEVMRCLYPSPEPVVRLGAKLRAQRWSLFADGWQDLLGLPLQERFTVGTTAAPGGVFSAGAVNDHDDFVALRGWSAGAGATRHLVLVDEAGRICGLGLGGHGYRVRPGREFPPGAQPTAEWQALLGPGPKDRVRIYAVGAPRGHAQPLGDWHAISTYRTVRANRIGAPILPTLATRLVTTFGSATFPGGAEPPTVPWPWWSSFVHGDHDVARFALGPIPVPDDRTLVVPYITGPAADGLKLELRDAGSGALLAAAMPMMPAMSEWHGWIVRLPADAPRSVVVVAEDQGTAWGQWLAVGSPCTLLPPPPETTR